MKAHALLFGIVLLTGCAETSLNENEPEERISIQEEMQSIDELRRNFSGAISSGEYQKLQGYSARDIQTVGPGSSDWAEMYRLGEERGRFPYDSIRMEPIETALLNDSMAYDWGSSTVYYSDSTGNVVELTDRYLVLLKKEDGEWKVFREVASSGIPR